jgi:hypothetical protein
VAELFINERYLGGAGKPLTCCIAGALISFPSVLFIDVIVVLLLLQ